MTSRTLIIILGILLLIVPLSGFSGDVRGILTYLIAIAVIITGISLPRRKKRVSGEDAPHPVTEQTS